MFGKIFGKRKTQAISNEESRNNTIAASIEHQAQQDPLLRAKLGSRLVFNGTIESLRDERGVHAETLLGVLGALAGFACPASIAAMAHSKGVTVQQMGVMVIGTKDGNEFWAGDGLNRPLLIDQMSIWSLVAGMAQKMGASDLPDMQELLGRVVASFGKSEFGVPNLPGIHHPAILPVECVKMAWKKFETNRQECPAEQWPLMFGLAVQQAIQMSAKQISPNDAVRIVMEYSTPTSRLDPASVF